jgi:TPR repeat protein
MSHRGLGVQRDLGRAIDSWRNAAEAGAGMAQNALGSAYLNGNVTAPDLIKTYAWFRLAAESGVAVANSNADMTFAQLNDLQRELAIAETQVLKQSLPHE